MGTERLAMGVPWWEREGEKLGKVPATGGVAENGMAVEEVEVEKVLAVLWAARYAISWSTEVFAAPPSNPRTSKALPREDNPFSMADTGAEEVVERHWDVVAPGGAEEEEEEEVEDGPPPKHFKAKANSSDFSTQ